MANDAEEVDLCDICGDSPAGECECCEDCGEQICECCPNCEMAPMNCECCEDCGCSPCDCESECGNCGEYGCDGECDESKGSMGTSSKPGWIKRGLDVKNIVKETDWQAVWPEIDVNYDPCMGAAEFYLLEAIAADVANGVQGRPVTPLLPNTRERDDELLKAMGVTTKAARTKRIKERDQNIVERRAADPEYDLAWIMGEASLRLREVVDRADASLVAYFHMACAGEARHHMAIGGKVLAGPSNRDAAWTGWRAIYEKVGPEAIKDLSALLAEIGGGNYGGVRWADAADVLYQRVTGELGPNEEVNKRLFVDRAWTLQHNGGCFLNKIGWGVRNRKGWNLDSLQSKVLEAHCANPPRYRVLAGLVSEDILDLFHRYWDASNARRVAIGLDETPNPYLNVQRRLLCKYCNSNPEVGHSFGCEAPKMKDFNGGALTPNAGWLMEVEEDDWNNYHWGNWNKKTQIVGPDGSMTLPSDTSTVVKFDLVINSEGRGLKHYTRKKMTDLATLMDMKFVPKSFGKSQGALGEILSYEWWVEIHVKLEDGSMHRVVQASDTWYGKEYMNLPKSHPMYKSAAEIKNWKTTPISMGDQVAKHLPGLQLGEPTKDKPKTVDGNMTYVLSTTKTKETVSA